jgi:glc operon protein GlcG
MFKVDPVHRSNMWGALSNSGDTEPLSSASMRRARAKKAMAAAEAKARQNNCNVVISIVDSGGHAVMLQRLDGSHLAAIGIAEGKARTAVEFRRPTKALEDAMAGGGVGLKYFTVRGVMLIEGGIPIVVDGKIVEARGEPMHRICPTCYERGHKSILQFAFKTISAQDRYDCPNCETVFELGMRRPIPSSPPRSGGW